MDQKLIEIIDNAIAYLNYGWCKKALARDEDNNMVGTYDEKACKWCLYGALWRGNTAVDGDNETFTKVVRLIQSELSMDDFISPLSLGKWNDEQESVDDVISLLERVKCTLNI
jgi:hypothetical protein